MMLLENNSFVKKKIIEPVKNLLPLMKTSWKMSWPIMVMMVFEFFMSMTDIYIAGRFGEAVKAATGLASQVYSFFIMTGHALTIGAVSVLSRLFTSDDKKKFRSAVFTSVISAFSFGVVICIIGVTFSSKIATLLNAPEEVKGYASSLIEIYFLGIIFHMTLINMNGVLRSCKRVTVTMGVMVFAAVLNIILVLYFYNFTDLGFQGIAISTAVSITSASIINMVIMFRIISKTYVFSFPILKQILSIGWPGGIVSLSWQLGGTALYAVLGMLSYNSVEIMAAYATGLRIESAIFMPAFAFNMANAVIVGNLMGEKKYNEAYKSGLTTAFISVSVVTVMIIVIVLNARFIAEFLEPNPVVVNEIVKYIYICMIAEPFIALNLAMTGALNGAGDTKAVMFYAVLNVWVLRLPLAYILGIALGFHASGIWWALNSGFFLQSALSTRRFISKKWQKIEII
ncbi:MAG: MATE family efflux transporter [Candidatus Mucispirillum faecigallinarum]|nr:MATE family efflux transporter [Candidatus Mucispirillum faecigallinarum]